MALGIGQSPIALHLCHRGGYVAAAHFAIMRDAATYSVWPWPTYPLFASSYCWVALGPVGVGIDLVLPMLLLGGPAVPMLLLGGGAVPITGLV